jgi:hypothetical protein
MMKLSQNSERDMPVYKLGNMFTARLGLEELIPLVISKCREVFGRWRSFLFHELR